MDISDVKFNYRCGISWYILENGEIYGDGIAQNDQDFTELVRRICLSRNLLPGFSSLAFLFDKFSWIGEFDGCPYLAQILEADLNEFESDNIAVSIEASEDCFCRCSLCRLSGGIASNDKDWSQAVKRRDGYKCIICGSKKYVQTHHLKGRAQFPELKLQVNNGVSLCLKHHGDLEYPVKGSFHDIYGHINFTSENFYQYFRDLTGKDFRGSHEIL